MSDSYKTKGFRHFLNAFDYSLSGLKAAFQQEAAFRHELSALCVLLPTAFWLDVSAAERAIMVASLFLVLIVELINSSIEAVVDRVGLERHPLSGQAKDMGSSAVFIAMMLVLLVWGIVLGDRFTVA